MNPRHAGRQESILDAVASPPEPPGADDPCTAEQLAAWLKVNPKSLYRLARANRIPHLRIGKCVRFIPSIVVATLSRAGRG